MADALSLDLNGNLSDNAASDDEYDESYDASAQIFSPRRAENVEELLEKNPFESDGEDEESDSSALVNPRASTENCESSTYPVSQVSTPSNTETSLNKLWAEAEHSEDFQDWRGESKNKKKSRVWGLIKGSKAKGNDVMVEGSSSPKGKDKQSKYRKALDKAKSKQKKQKQGKRHKDNIEIVRVVAHSSTGDTTLEPGSPRKVLLRCSSLTRLTTAFQSNIKLTRSVSLEFGKDGFLEKKKEKRPKQENRSFSSPTELPDTMSSVSANSPPTVVFKSNVSFCGDTESKGEVASPTNRPKPVAFANDNSPENSFDHDTSYTPILTPPSAQPKKSQRRKPSSKLQPVMPDALIFQLVPLKEGHLLHKRRRRWVILDKQNVYIFKSVEDFKAPKVINLHCTAVRRVVKEATPALEIVTSGHTFVFHVDKEEKGDKGVAIDSWITEIQRVCDELVLSSIGGGDGDNQNDNILSKSYSMLLSRSDVLQARTGNIRAEQRKVIEVAVQDGNRVCADCGAKDPEWASINIGVFICIECSGIHRSFGTHISKVRSVKLDKWDNSWVEIMKSIGNARANQVWLCNVPAEMTPITENSDLEERKKWLTLKYVDGRFTKDWEPPVNNAITEMKNFSQEFRTQFKAVLLQCLVEDPEFRGQLKNLLTQGIESEDT